MTDIQIIRDALEYCRGFAGDEPCYISMRHCLDDAMLALSRLEERCLPELPKGWACRLQYEKGEAVAAAGKIGSVITKKFRAATPREAIQNAINKIREVK